jgi:hypothetical protein
VDLSTPGPILPTLNPFLTNRILHRVKPLLTELILFRFTLFWDESILIIEEARQGRIEIIEEKCVRVSYVEAAQAGSPGQ